jgi:cation diffusion facilitator family transporter
MHTRSLKQWRHDHVFAQDEKRAGEKRTLVVVVLTLAMMVVEIAGGLVYGSMALLADGLHMASHAAALGIAVFAYVLSRHLASDRRFAFGVGKLNSLAGFASAVMLLGFALAMVTESTERLLKPVPIAFDQALLVAVVGLLVNAVSAVILAAPAADRHHSHVHPHVHRHDHNLRAAYLHVLADALTSVLAIVALLAGKHLGARWLDPAMGLVGALLVARWSYSLIRDASRVLLDRQIDAHRAAQLREAIEGASSDRISDLHLWSIGQDIYAAELAIVSDDPQTPDHYKSLIPPNLNIVHATIEVHRCADH